MKLNFAWESPPSRSVTCLARSNGEGVVTVKHRLHSLIAVKLSVSEENGIVPAQTKTTKKEFTFRNELNLRQRKEYKDKDVYSSSQVYLNGKQAKGKL